MSIEKHLERIAISLEKISFFLEENHDRMSKMNDDSSFTQQQTKIHTNIETNIENIEEHNHSKIYDFLKNLGITVKCLPPEEDSDSITNNLALFLGSRFNSLKQILALIKRNMQTGNSFSILIKDYTQKEISDICQFCTELHKYAFLENYQYTKSPTYLIRAKTTTLPIAQNFFSGKWLEKFILLILKKSILDISQKYNLSINFNYLLNPQIILPNGDDFELDLIFHINEQFYWIEAKTSDYQQHINKYSKFA